MLMNEYNSFLSVSDRYTGIMKLMYSILSTYILAKDTNNVDIEYCNFMIYLLAMHVH